MGWFTEKVDRIIIVNTPQAIQLPNQSDIEKTEAFLKLLCPLFRVTKIDLSEYFSCVPDEAQISSTFWAIVHKNHLPRKELITKAVQKRLGLKVEGLHVL